MPTSSQAPGGLTAPTDGVVVRWRLEVGSLTTPTTLRILREGPKPFDDFFAVGTGQPTVIPTANQLSTFEIRLPIQAGDRLGINCCAAAYLDAFALTTDAPLYYWSPVLLDGATPSVANGEYTEHELLLNADIEPDVDADGFGDETQDQCPTDTSTQVPCPPGADTDPPDTEITKTPPNKNKKSKARYKFTSDDPSATFECSLKGKGLDQAVKQFVDCDSPRKYKGLDEGKFKFQVRAVDAAGNVDSTPAKDKFKVVD